MATANEKLAAAGIDHAVDLGQYSSHVVRRLLRLLNRVDVNLADALSKALTKMSATSFTVERLERVLGSVREINAEAYARVGLELTKELQTFSAYEASYQADLFERVIPKPIQVVYEVTRLNPETVYSAALSRPFQGRLLKDWAKKLPSDRLEVIRNAVRMGYISGKPAAQIVTEMRGTKAKGYEDGAIQRSRRELETVVRTSISHTAAVTRERFHDANEDIIAAVIWTATLDTRTSEICRIRDNRKYTVTDHKPIGHTYPWLQGPGRSHWHCRSSARSALKSWKDLGFSFDQLPASSRASMDGAVPDDVSYGDWLQKQSNARQDEVVGQVRGELMRAGRMPFDRLYDAKGRYLTIDELRARDAAAFERAGL